MSEKFINLIEFISKSKDSESDIPDLVMTDIKDLFKAYLMQAQVMEKATQQKDERIKNLEEELSQLEEILKSKINTSKSNSPNKNVEATIDTGSQWFNKDDQTQIKNMLLNSNEVLEIKRQFAEEKESLIETHKLEISNLEEKIFYLSQDDQQDDDTINSLNEEKRVLTLQSAEL